MVKLGFDPRQFLSSVLCTLPGGREDRQSRTCEHRDSGRYWMWEAVRVERRVRTGVGRTWCQPGQESDGKGMAAGSATALSWGPGLRWLRPQW